MVSHAGHFLYDFWLNPDHFLPGSPSAYLVSKPLNRLEFNPTYPKTPNTLGEYIRKRGMEQGISQVELAKAIGVNEMTIVNWEIKARIPRIARHFNLSMEQNDYFSGGATKRIPQESKVNLNWFDRFHLVT